MDKHIKNVPLILFIAYASKLIALGASLTDAAILLILGAVSSYLQYKFNDKQLVEMSKKIEAIESKTNIDHNNLDEIRTNLSGLKLKQNLKLS